MYTHVGMYVCTCMYVLVGIYLCVRVNLKEIIQLHQTLHKEDAKCDTNTRHTG